jgi:hypothetical protein
MPDAWQPVHKHILVSPRKSKRINVLGCFKKDNTLPPYMLEGTVESEIGMACFDDLCPSLATKTVGG